MNHRVLDDEEPQTPHAAPRNLRDPRDPHPRDERGREDPRFRALAEGKLSSAEIAALEREALTEEQRAWLELYRPFDAAERDRIFNRAQPRIRANRKITRWGAISAIGAAAAALAIYTHTPRPKVDVAWDLVRAPAAAEAPPQTLAAPDAELIERIVPRRSITERLVVRGTLLLREGKVRVWSPPVAPPSPRNVISIAGTKRELFPCVPAGTWEMIVAVGVPGAPLAEGELVRLAGQPSAGPYQVLRRRVVLEGEAVNADGSRCAEGT